MRRHDLLDYSIEYGHIYTNERVGNEEHARSVGQLRKVLGYVSQRTHSLGLCVMVDDSASPKITLTTPGCETG